MTFKAKLEVDHKALSRALKKAPKIILGSFRRHLKQEMQDTADQAKRRHKFKTRSADLERSIRSRVSRAGTVGEIFLDTGVAHYGPFQHNGTGIYGPKKRPIRARKFKNLRFIGSNGRWVSKFEVRGVKPDPFLDNAMRFRLKDINKNMNKVFVRALKKTGVGY